MDYITEVSVSHCDKFVASAGKDATVCLWDVVQGKLAYRLTHHSKVVNCVKFFCPKATDGRLEQQLLYTCSDDGAVHLFDISKISGDKIQCEKSQLGPSEGPLGHENLHSVEL
jgi:WD40 repeat protein